MLENASIGRTKALSEENLSSGNITSSRAPEGQNVIAGTRNHFSPEASIQTQAQPLVETRPDQHEEKSLSQETHCVSAAFNHPTPIRPVARVSAFNVYSPSGGPAGSTFTRTTPTQGPLIQASKPELVISKLLEDACDEPVIPLQCGHCCCKAPSRGHSQNSVLGPDFVDYDESAPLTSHELISIATDLSNIAWIKSGLDSNATRIPDNFTSLGADAAGSQMGLFGQGTKTSQMCFEEGRNRLMSMMRDSNSTPMPGQTLVMPAEVQGLS